VRRYEAIPTRRRHAAAPAVRPPICWQPSGLLCFAALRTAEREAPDADGYAEPYAVAPPRQRLRCYVARVPFRLKALRRVIHIRRDAADAVRYRDFSSPLFFGRLPRHFLPPLPRPPSSCRPRAPFLMIFAIHGVRSPACHQQKMARLAVSPALRVRSTYEAQNQTQNRSASFTIFRHFPRQLGAICLLFSASEKASALLRRARGSAMPARGALRERDFMFWRDERKSCAQRVCKSGEAYEQRRHDGATAAIFTPRWRRAYGDEADARDGRRRPATHCRP